jgi:hypothetical protein
VNGTIDAISHLSMQFKKGEVGQAEFQNTKKYPIKTKKL